MMNIDSIPILLEGNSHIQEIIKPSSKWKFYILSYETESVRPMNQSAYEILCLIDGKRRIEDICRIIFDKFKVGDKDKSLVQERIIHFLEELYEMKVVTFSIQE